MRDIVVKSLGTLAFVCAMLGASARDWYIDANNGNDETGDGTAEFPFATINRASTNSTALAAGDTIWVRPGTYSTGAYVDADGVSNRVYIAKDINLRATDPECLTEIVGAKDETSGNSYGLGTAAIRCVRSSGSCTIQGFTLRDGATDVGDANKGYGGGYFSSSLPGGYLVDCIVRNCSATKGGGVRNGYVARTLFTDCTSSSNGGASNGGSLSFCVIVNCGGIGSVSNSKTVNCTFICNKTNPIVGSTASYNCLFLGNSQEPASGVPLNSCLSDSNGGVALLIGPAVGDYRPIEGSVAATAGDRSYLAQAPSGYGDKDFSGDDIAETGDIPVGAVFSVSPAPAAGCIYFKGGSATVDGVTVASGLWMYPTNYPVQWTVAPVVPEGSHFYCFVHDDSTGWRSYAQMDGTCRMIPPPDPSMVTTSTVTFASKAYWVNPDPEIGSDSNSGTDADHPFLTLQKCVDSAGYNSVKTVVYASAGEYNRGGMDRSSTQGSGYCLTNRVACIQGNCEVLIRGAGAGRSFITGAPDPTTGGNGRAAVRVAALYSQYAVLQGFTLCNGYTDAADGTSAAQEKIGILLRGSYGAQCSRLIDCVVSNVTAAAYVVQNGRLERCRVVNNQGGANTVTEATFVSTLFAGNRHSAGNTGIIGTCRLFGSTIVGCSSSSDLVLQRNSSGVYLSIIDTASYLYKPSGDCFSNLVQNIGAMESGAYGFKSATIKYVDRENLDFRVGMGSPAAVSAGSVADANWFAKIYKDLCGDVDGKSMSFEGGVPVIGAFRAPVPSVTVSAPSGGIASSVGFGSGLPVAGDVTISASDDATLPCIGFTCSGKTNLFETASSFVLTTADLEAAGGDVLIEALYSTDWYVDGEHGDDGNSGTRRNDAFRTFARALTNGLLAAGHTVHVAAGTYAEDKMKNADSSLTYSRAVVPANVALVADDGPENTFIVGAVAPEGDSMGLGDGAVRCVFLNAGATVRGFTLTGGRTRKPSSPETNNEKTYADWTGGAVRGSGTTSVIADCIVSNNCANRGGGAFDATFLRCRVIGNKGVNGGSAGNNTSATGTLFAKNSGSAYVLMYPPSHIVGCTMASDNTATYLVYFDGNKRLVNNVFLGNVRFNFSGQSPNYMTNCVFTATPSSSGSVTLGVGSYVTNSTAIALGDDYRPVVGRSVCVDAAYEGEDVLSIMGDRDASGKQRVYNNALDIGALEADFRPAFAKAMGDGHRITVTSADPTVRLAEGGVAISSGSLEATWRSVPGRAVDYRFNAAVSGGGCLTAAANGVTNLLDAASGATTVSFSSDRAENGLSFSFTPDAEAPGGFAVLSDFTRCMGMILIVQ
ncbi:MAG: hypothetical protein IKE55_01565 [Kiritimatiellae bacterium]|nr:hypothetical protein [Kiritimatiellia bacterium]